MKVIVAQTAFLGDLVLTTSLLATLRVQHPDAEIDVLARADLAPILGGHRVIPFDKRGTDRGLGGLRRMAKTLRGYDMAVVAHESFRTALLLWLARIPRRVGFRGAPGALFYTEKRDRRAGHYVDRLHALVGADAEGRGRAPSLEVDPAAATRVKALLAEAGVGDDERVALLAPGSVWATKQWTPDGFSEVARTLRAGDIRVVLTGGPDDRAAADAIDADVVDLVGRTSLPELVALAARASLFVGNDSGAMHVAAAVGTPVVAIFGPTTPELGFGPRSAAAAETVGIGLDCRPCHAHGPMRCPLGHHRCMKDLPAGEVLAAIGRVSP